MTKIPSDDILEGLYKLRIRVSEKLQTVLELYDLEIYQKKIGPDYHRLKTMVKRSIEQDIRNKNFGARNENFEKSAVVKNQETKQRVQRILGDCWQWPQQSMLSGHATDLWTSATIHRGTPDTCPSAWELCRGPPSLTATDIGPTAGDLSGLKPS